MENQTKIELLKQKNKIVQISVTVKQSDLDNLESIADELGMKRSHICSLAFSLLSKEQVIKKVLGE